MMGLLTLCSRMPLEAIQSKIGRITAAKEHKDLILFFCAFCAFLRLFPSYLSALGFQAQLPIRKAFSTERAREVL
jgi:hypothetical protein